MKVRLLQEVELEHALRLVGDVFMQDVASGYTEEGVKEFSDYISYENMSSLYKSGELLFWGAGEEDSLLGVIAMRPDGHISLFFVKKEKQGKGIGKMLFQTAYNYVAQRPEISKITVNAAPNSVPVYTKLGMHTSGEIQCVNGISFVPMELLASSVLVRPVRNRSQRRLMVGLAFAVTFLIIGGLAFAAGKYAGRLWSESEPYFEQFKDKGSDDEIQQLPTYPDGDSQEDSETEEELSGIDAVESYIQDDLNYEIKEQKYNYFDDEAVNSYIEFQVQYPELIGIDEAVSDRINEKLKECAMQTVERIYNHPSAEFKEKILGIEKPVLVDYLHYKVCYATDDFISIAFQDYAFEGQYKDRFQQLRTINIDLNTGDVFEVKDIVKLDDEFMSQWLKTMKSEAENDKFLSELSMKEMKSALEGSTIDGNYQVIFFVKKGAVEIGYSLDYQSGDENDLGYGWVTAPFTYDELQSVKNDSKMWEYVGK